MTRCRQNQLLAKLRWSLDLIRTAWTSSRLRLRCPIHFCNSITGRHKHCASAPLIAIPKHICGIYLHPDAVLREPQGLRFVNDLIQQPVCVLRPLFFLFVEFFGCWFGWLLLFLGDSNYGTGEQEENN